MNASESAVGSLGAVEAAAGGEAKAAAGGEAKAAAGGEAKAAAGGEARAAAGGEARAAAGGEARAAAGGEARVAAGGEGRAAGGGEARAAGGGGQWQVGVRRVVRAAHRICNRGGEEGFPQRDSSTGLLRGEERRGAERRVSIERAGFGSRAGNQGGEQAVHPAELYRCLIPRLA
jgi:hypothetical protein